MKSLHQQNGFSVVELVIVIAVLAVVGAVGYTVKNRQTAVTTPVSSTSAVTGSAKATNVGTAPTIQTTSDLDTAAATLDQNDPGSTYNSDLGQLDTETSDF